MRDGGDLNDRLYDALVSTHMPLATPDNPPEPSYSSSLLAVSHLTREEIDVLMVAVAKSLDPETRVVDAWQAAGVIWKHGGTAGPILTSLATMFAELRGPS